MPEGVRGAFASFRFRQRFILGFSSLAESGRRSPTLNALASEASLFFSMHKRLRQGGFTLIELMIVVTVIGILSALAIPAYRGYLQQSRMSEAKPYMLDIASKMRSYKVRNGVYCCSGSTLDETVLTAGLNVDPAATGNFCFAVICRDAALCGTTTSTNFIASSEAGDSTVEFEVWAVLRASSTTTVTGPQGAICRMAATKQQPTGWVQASSSSLAGREGQVLVYRYPAPPNGRDAVSGQDSVIFTWLEGLSESHAASN
jgi:prepilin-type N-terminal cleavage/methylation domain-containing protein